MNDWIPIDISPEEFNLSETFASGQAFRWEYNTERDEFVGAIGSRLWRLQQKSNTSAVSYHRDCLSEMELESKSPPQDLVSYFRLDVNLSRLLGTWLRRDSILAASLVSPTNINAIKGIRLLRQHPTETVIAFITSSNNTVTRIASLLSRLAVRHGRLISAGSHSSGYQFPTLECLTQFGMEKELRDMGFGYRAKYIPAAARIIQSYGGDAFLRNLRTVDYSEAKNFLLSLPGIGNKVADCVCLYSLDKVEVVPVDVHMSRAALNRGIDVGRSKGLSSKNYNLVAQRLSALWTPWAGWAQTIVFAIHLHSNIS